MRAADRQDARSALSSVSHAIGAFCLAVALCAFFGTHACNAQRYINVDGSDSVLVRNIQVVQVPSEAPVLLVDYWAIDSLSDTAALRRRAVAIFFKMKSRLQTEHITNFVVRAAMRDARFQVQKEARFNLYGFVFQKRANGEWHFLADSSVIATDPPPSAAHRRSRERS